MTTKIKIYIAVASVFLILVAGYSLWSSHQIRKLENAAGTAKQDAEFHEQRANELEMQSRKYEEKIVYLETILAELKTLAQKQDEELKNIETTTGRTRADVERARSIRSAAATAEELAESSPTSGTRVSEQLMTNNEQLLSACNAAADELRASRILIWSGLVLNAALRARLDTEKRANELLDELNETRRAESEAAQATVAAKNETIAAKDAAIAAQDKLIESLKTKKRSPWARIADILLGAGVIAISK